MENIVHYTYGQQVKVKYAPPTNTKGSRIILTGFELRKILPFDFSSRSIWHQAAIYLQQHYSVTVVGVVDRADYYILLLSDVLQKGVSIS